VIFYHLKFLFSCERMEAPTIALLNELWHIVLKSGLRQSLPTEQAGA
jgi:hypothetical protein